MYRSFSRFVMVGEHKEKRLKKIFGTHLFVIEMYVSHLVAISLRQGGYREISLPDIVSELIVKNLSVILLATKTTRRAICYGEQHVCGLRDNNNNRYYGLIVPLCFGFLSAKAIKQIGLPVSQSENAYQNNRGKKWISLSLVSMLSSYTHQNWMDH